MIPGSGYAVFLDGDTVELVPVTAWVNIDFGGDVSDLKACVVRGGSLGIADDAEDFCGYVSNYDASRPAYEKNLNACLKEAQRLRKVTEVAH